jgi:nicotinamide mononucleotide (NMN) deamidase PncC
MAEAARAQLRADIGVGVTGVAGPAEQEGKPIGTVYISVASATETLHSANQFRVGRTDFKSRAANAALFQIRQLILKMSPDTRTKKG